MRITLTALLLVAILGSAPLSAIDTSPPLPDPVQQVRYKNLLHEFRCLKCQGETVADTPAMFAVDIRRQVREMIQDNRSDTEIRQYMVDRYGEVILLRPQWSLKTAWLWIAPFMMLIVGGVAASRILKQRQRLLVSDAMPVEADQRWHGQPDGDDNSTTAARANPKSTQEQA